MVSLFFFFWQSDESICSIIYFLIKFPRLHINSIFQDNKMWPKERKQTNYFFRKIINYLQFWLLLQIEAIKTSSNCFLHFVMFLEHLRREGRHREARKRGWKSTQSCWSAKVRLNRIHWGAEIDLQMQQDLQGLNLKQKTDTHQNPLFILSSRIIASDAKTFKCAAKHKTCQRRLAREESVVNMFWLMLPVSDWPIIIFIKLLR